MHRLNKEHFGIGNITHPLQNKIADPIQHTASDVKDKAADVATDVKKTADTAVSGAKGAFGKVKNFAKNVGNFLKNIFECHYPTCTAKLIYHHCEVYSFTLKLF